MRDEYDWNLDTAGEKGRKEESKEESESLDLSIAQLMGAVEHAYAGHGFLMFNGKEAKKQEVLLSSSSIPPLPLLPLPFLHFFLFC